MTTYICTYIPYLEAESVHKISNVTLASLGKCLQLSAVLVVKCSPTFSCGQLEVNTNSNGNNMVEEGSGCMRQTGTAMSTLLSASNLKVGATVKLGGKYVWTDRELLMHLQNYTPLILLIDFVEKTRTKRFYEASERYEILMLIFIIRKGSPFCENKRYPEEYWVNLSVGAIAEAFDRLQAAIDVPDPQLPIHMSVTDLTSWKQMFDAAMAEIRRYTYYTEPHQLADVGIYNRSMFEERFGMQWLE